MRVVVVGAGISGLTVAYDLLEKGLGPDGDRPEVTVLDADERVGGKIRTHAFAGHAVDAGADSFLAGVPGAVELCHELGLGDQLVAPAARSAFLYSRGELRRFPEATVLGVPTDLEALQASGVISPEGVARAELDLTLPAGPADPGSPADADESVGALVRGPLLSGVNAGNADELSVLAGAPQLAAAVRRQPSLITGLRSQRAAAATTNGGAETPVFLGFPTGTATLTNSLATRIEEDGGRIHLSTRVKGLDTAEGDRAGGYVLHTDRRGTFEADAVVLATPDPVSAALLAELEPAVATGLAAVDYASVTMVAFAIPRDQIDHPLDGSGFLVAHPEGLVLTACSWASAKWAHLADPDVVIFRASAGRAGDPRADELTDPELVAILHDELASVMGPIGDPVAVRLTRWSEALPQFRPGHLERVRAWDEALVEHHPGLVLAGAGTEGLGIPACIRRARSVAKALPWGLGAAKLA